MGYIRELIINRKLKEDSRMSEKDFTRERKVGFVALISMILNMLKRTTQIEIDEFLKEFFTKDGKRITYTKQSFSEARQKLSPEVFIMLNDELVKRYYEDDDFKKYKGYRLLAVDGSYIEVPNTTELREHYGYATNSNSDQKVARALSTAVYDVENKIVIGSLIGRYDDSERELEIKNITRIKDLEQEKIKDLMLFDRGYPSIEFLLFLFQSDIKFLMRTSLSFYKEVRNTKTRDEIVEIVITKERARGCRKRGKFIPAGTSIKLRVLKIMLDSGEIETLITDLDENELSYEESKELYFKRWGIETKFDELKNKFEIENFSGIKPLIIEQDFHATILLSNFASMFKQDAEEELIKTNKDKNLKHEYKINKNILIGKLKNSFIKILLEDSDFKRNILYTKFIYDLKKNVVAEVKGRAFDRNKSLSTNRHSNARRRSI